ncbi:P-loop containing nucleoside triphosphate hydrolase protein, partial [Meira miltonrushii]
MPLPTSKKDAGLGRAMINRKAKDAQNRSNSSYHTTDLINPSTGGVGLRSITQQTDLEEFLSTAQLADQNFTAERRNVTVVSAPDQMTGAKRGKNPLLPTQQEADETVRRQNENKQRLRIPRRPAWNSSTTPEQLHRLEADAFLDWRRNLAELAEANNFILTPFERNLEVWKQLWRVVERGQLIIQIVDARNPLRFRSEDLEKYVEELEVRLGQAGEDATFSSGKRRNLLLLNKADLLDEGQRQEWARYFTEKGIQFAFFSAANAAALQAARAEAEALEALDAQSGEEDEEDDDEEEDDEVREARKRAAAVTLGARDTKPLVGEEAAEHILLANREKIQRMLREEREAGQNDSVDAAMSTTAGQASLGSSKPSVTARDPAHVLNILELEELIVATMPPLEDFGVDEHRVSFIGFPNVGKSSTINALAKSKKVSVSSTPGKTKHFQTIKLSDNLTLVDCPGLVLPVFAITSAELVLDGVLPIDQLREYTAPADLLAARIPKDIIEGTYGFRIPIQHEEEGGSGQPTGLEVLTAYAIARGFARQGQGNPDESRAARYVFKDYVNAKLLFAHPPPGVDADAFNASQRAHARELLSGRK